MRTSGYIGWGVPTAGSQCPAGTYSWEHRVVATFHKAGWGETTLYGPWVGGTSKSYVSAGYGWNVIAHHVEQDGNS
jgi:hypothetical protein